MICNKGREEDEKCAKKKKKYNSWEAEVEDG